MKVLVCGGRAFHNKEAVQSVLDNLYKSRDISLIIHGGARGADKLAGEWAHKVGIACAEYKANWDFYKKAAGPIRNGWMLQFGEPDLVVAFPGGDGTADMVRSARKRMIEVLEL